MEYTRNNKPLKFTDYQSEHKTSIANSSAYWLKESSQLDWIQPPTVGFNGDLKTGDIRWFEDGILNVCFNCIDRHLPEHANETAIIWEDNNPEISTTLTYQELHDAVAKFANALKSHGVNKGDSVCIYMPMIPEAAIAMLACTRIGAIHSVVFGGFSPESLADRILDADSRCIITADGAMRGEKFIPLKDSVDEALASCPNVSTVFVTSYIKEKVVNLVEGRDIWVHDIIDNQEAHCPCEPMSATDPLFILYTSGSTGKPKGILHSTGGYLLYITSTFKTAFDYQPGDVFWCTADVGWITGHSYTVYGALSNAATTLMFAGIPNYPTASRCWEIVDKHNVAVFYTAPTAIRALMREGDEFVTKTSRHSLKVLGTVGEPINPEVWQWYASVVGNDQCPIVDTWFQTETAGFMICPLAGVIPQIPGTATQPFYGIDIALLDDNGEEIEGEGKGILVIKQAWPGMMTGIYGDHQRFIDTYLASYPGYYLAGDAAHRDKLGNYMITGRIDDVINISGHRIGTAEVESVFVEHDNIAESAVVGMAHPIKGEALYAFVSLKHGVEPSSEMRRELFDLVTRKIGSFAKPDILQFVEDLPKTRSGKIMRRILRKIAAHDSNDLGDISTLANPEVVNSIIEQANNA